MQSEWYVCGDHWGTAQSTVRALRREMNLEPEVQGLEHSKDLSKDRSVKTALNPRTV